MYESNVTLMPYVSFINNVLISNYWRGCQENMVHTDVISATPPWILKNNAPIWQPYQYLTRFNTWNNGVGFNCTIYWELSKTTNSREPAPQILLLLSANVLEGSRTAVHQTIRRQMFSVHITTVVFEIMLYTWYIEEHIISTYAWDSQQ